MEETFKYKMLASPRPRHPHLRRTRSTKSNVPPSHLPSPGRPMKHASAQDRPNSSIYKSQAVLEEILRVEKESNLLSMQPEEALQLLQELLLDLDMRTFSRTELLEGLAQACWHLPANKPLSSFISSAPSPSKKPLLSPRNLPRILPNTTGGTMNQLFPLRYTQLYRGLSGTLQQKQQEVEGQEKTLNQVIQMNNSIPQEIHQVEAKIQDTVKTFTQWTAVALDQQQQSSRNNSDQILALFKEELVKLHRRKELRIWSCNDLRSVIQDHISRASELKKEISQVVFDLKKEEQEHHENVKRINEFIQTEKNQNARIISLQQSIRMLEDQIDIAKATKLDIQRELQNKKSIVRTKTQAIFDVRVRLNELQTRKTNALIQIDKLSEEDLYIKRTCTPRPEWESLMADTQVTTAIDRVGSMRRIRFEENSTDKQQQQEKAAYINQILTSRWSTIEKIQALANELIQIRAESHSEEDIAIEKEHLEHLQLEIAKTLEQLQAVKKIGSATTQKPVPVPVPVPSVKSTSPTPSPPTTTTTTTTTTTSDATTTTIALTTTTSS